MKRDNLISLVVSSILLGSTLSALTLKEAVQETLETNPVVKERLKNFNETQQDLEIVKSEWLPSLDYRASIGRVNSGSLKDNKNKNWNHTTEDTSYSHYTNSLKLTQNIFKGFSTTNKINYQEARILAAANHYVENVNDIAFQTSGAYIDVIRSYKLLQNAKDNVAINEKIFNDVKSLYEQGLTTKSEMTKINASLALAKSNLVVQQNNTIDKEARFKRLFGRDINIAELELPKLDLAMPESKERATQVAITNNPSMLVSKYNIKGAEALYQEKKSKFYPTVDIELEQLYNDYGDNKGNPLDTQDDRQRAYIVLNWNLFNGFADSSDIQKSKSTIYKESEIQRDLKRQTIEGLELSWNAYELLGEQLKDLYSYYDYSKETLESYQSEYEMGRRTLLDLLTAQNDLISSKSQIINAQMDKLFAQYRILDAMGMLPQSILDEGEYNKIIDPKLNPFVVKKDELPVNKDVDSDGIVDSLDNCDNSKLKLNDITPYGCNQKTKDSDFDGVSDELDKCPNTMFGKKVDANGCPLDESELNIQDTSYTTNVEAYNASSPKKASASGLYDYEFNVAANKNIASTNLDKHLYYDDFSMIKRYEFINMNENSNSKLDAMANELKKYNNSDAVVTIIGNTRSNDDKQASYNKAMEYANSVKQALVDRGVDNKILVAQSRVDFDRYYLETNRSDKKLNDVTAVALYVPKAKIAQVTQVANTPKVVDGDDDKDGVLNSQDRCPNTPAGYSVDEYGCTKTINLEVLFENNSAIVVDSSKDKVLAFAKFLKDNKEFNAQITGHASKEGKSSAEFNRVLSEKRANAIKNLLVSNGVDSNRLSATGKGYDEPIADNSTAEGQAKNRRIEAVLIRK